MQCKISCVTFVWRYDIQDFIRPTVIPHSFFFSFLVLTYTTGLVWEGFRVGTTMDIDPHCLSLTRAHKNTHILPTECSSFFLLPTLQKVLNLHKRRTQNRGQAFKM